MSQRNDDFIELTKYQEKKLKKLNVRLKRKISRIKRVHKKDITKRDVEVKKDFTSKKELQDYFKKTAKILDRNAYNYNIVKNESGQFSVRKENMKKLKTKVAEINKEYSKREKDLINKTKENFGEEISDMMKRDMEELKKPKRTKMSSNQFDDLKKLDVKKVLERMTSEKDLIEQLEKYDGNYYDLDKRDEQYRQNWITALMNEMGYNDKTEEIAKMVEELDLLDFITSYFNDYTEMKIKDIYDAKQQEYYLDYLLRETRKLFEKTMSESEVKEFRENRETIDTLQRLSDELAYKI